MQKKAGFAFGAFMLVAAFIWIVFDNLALGLLFGLFAGGAAGKTATPSETGGEQGKADAG